MNYTKAEIVKHNAPSTADVKSAKAKAFIISLNKSIEGADLTEFVERLEELSAESGADIKQIAAFLLKDKLKFDNIDESIDLNGGGSRDGRRGSRDFESRDSFKGGRDRERTSRSRDDRGERSFSDRGAKSTFSRGERVERAPREQGARTAGMTRLFMNAGKKDRLRPNDIVGAITGETEIKGSQIGNIDMFDKFCFVEVPVNMVNEVIDKMAQRKIKGLKVNFEVAND